MQNMRDILNHRGQPQEWSSLKPSLAALTNCFKSEGVSLGANSTIGYAPNMN